jgi:predicted ATP-grasp superfamily ATP-dependent carboligase
MTSHPNATVIVTYARSLIALAIARSLAQNGAEVIGIDDVDLTVLSFSKWANETDVHTRLADGEETYVADLERIIAKYKPQDGRPYVLMPAFNDAEVIARHADRLGKNITVAAPPNEAIDTIHPKDAFARAVTETGSSAPTSIVASDAIALDMVASDIGFPAIIKPADAVGGRGISKINTRAELDTAWKLLRDEIPGDPIVQDLSEGEDYCYGFLAKDGEILAEIAYRNLVSFPEDFGAGVVRETVDHSRFRKAAEPLVKYIGWTGIGQLDFMWTGQADQAPQMIELNPRFWANLDHAISSGVDFPALWLELATTGKLASAAHSPKIGHKSKIPGVWLLAAAEKAKKAAINDNADGKPEGAFNQLMSMIGQVPQLADSGSDLRQTLSRIGDDVASLREVDTAGLEDDDPMVGLGALFVLSSLMEHGELPPELKA